jgi:hypothetical protein
LIPTNLDKSAGLTRGHGRKSFAKACAWAIGEPIRILELWGQCA